MQYIFISAILYIFGDIFSKLYSMSDSKIQLGGAIMFYFLGSIFMILSIKNNSLSMAVLLMPPITILISVLIGYFYFEEQLFLIQRIGVILPAIPKTVIPFISILN